jgi:hypothetical protein
VIITVANDAAVSGTSWKWTISDTDVVTQNKIVNNSGENAVNSESIYLNTVGLGEVTVTARFSGNELYNPARKSITFTVVPKNVTSPTIELKDDATIYYDGEAKEPEVNVYYAEGKLIPDDQYTVTYQNNTNASTADSKAKIIVESVDGALYTIDAEKEFYIQETAVTVTELPAASDISYGQTLASSTLTGGKAMAGELEVEGTFAWKDATVAPTLADSEVTEYEVTFTPNDAIFKAGECKVKLKVLPSTTLFAANTTNQLMTWCDVNAWTLPEGCTAYTISSVSGSTVTISAVTAAENAPVIIPAYTPVLIQLGENITEPVTTTLSAVGIVPASGYDSETGLASTTATGWTFYGNAGNTKFTDDGETKYVHTIEEYDGTQSYVLRGGIFLKIDKDEGIAAHRCWLNVSAGSSNAARLNIVIGDEGTGITTTNYTNSEGAWYSLDGRKLDGKPTKKGLYINNGCKVVIK